MSELTTKHTPPKKTALGRGLGSLLGEASTTMGNKASEDKKVTLPTPAEVSVPAEKIVAAAIVPEHARIWQLPIEKVVRHEGQPRQHFDKQKLEELSLSIKQKGVLQPILVKKVGTNFEIVAGERRWRASQLAGLKEIPAIIKNFENQDSYEVALIEIIQRHDLYAVEDADA